MVFYIGFLLDGVKEYNNISEHPNGSLREKGKMTYYRYPPELQSLGVWDYRNDGPRLVMKVIGYTALYL